MDGGGGGGREGGGGLGSRAGGIGASCAWTTSRPTRAARGSGSPRGDAGARRAATVARFGAEGKGTGAARAAPSRARGGVRPAALRRRRGRRRTCRHRHPWRQCEKSRAASVAPRALWARGRAGSRATPRLAGAKSRRSGRLTPPGIITDESNRGNPVVRGQILGSRDTTRARVRSCSPRRRHVGPRGSIRMERGQRVRPRLQQPPRGRVQRLQASLGCRDRRRSYRGGGGDERAAAETANSVSDLLGAAARGRGSTASLLLFCGGPSPRRLSRRSWLGPGKQRCAACCAASEDAAASAAAASRDEKLAAAREASKRAEATNAPDKLAVFAREAALEAELVTGLKPQRVGGRGRGRGRGGRWSGGRSGGRG